MWNRTLSKESFTNPSERYHACRALTQVCAELKRMHLQEIVEALLSTALGFTALVGGCIFIHTHFILFTTFAQASNRGCLELAFMLHW